MTEKMKPLKNCTCCGRSNNFCHLDIQDVIASVCVRNGDMLAVWFSCKGCGSTMLTPVPKQFQKQLDEFTEGKCLGENCGKCQK